MKKHFLLFSVVVVNLILSFLLAAALATYVPVEAGVIELDTDYSTHSKEELRKIIDEQLSNSGQQQSLLQITRDRGTVLQAIVWVIGIFFMKRVGIQLLLYWVSGLAFGLTVGLYSLNQFVTILGVVAVAFLLKKFSQRKSIEANGLP